MRAEEPYALYCVFGIVDSRSVGRAFDEPEYPEILVLQLQRLEPSCIMKRLLSIDDNASAPRKTKYSRFNIERLRQPLRRVHSRTNFTGV